MREQTRTARVRLSEGENAMLMTERRWPGHCEAKDDHIVRRLGMTAIRYYRDLATLIDTERAVAFDPLLVARLRRARDDARRRQGVLG